ncbi:hypothetical protein [Streptomyces chattanoogensis]|uniref:hypothetical protein n=1 Tax=Streptomyces chattanoogensis TaxID=66876 RepID=UPI0012FE8EAF|nr:hypothetical protein [Streptomyces chattanoogensis]
MRLTTIFVSDSSAGGIDLESVDRVARRILSDLVDGPLSLERSRRLLHVGEGDHSDGEFLIVRIRERGLPDGNGLCTPLTWPLFGQAYLGVRRFPRLAHT